MTRILTALLLTTACMAAPAHAQSKAELAANDARLSQRLTSLEQRMLTGDPAAERIMQRLDSMESTVRNLTGEVEQLRFERDRLQGELKAMADSLREADALRERMELHLQAVDMVAARSPVGMTSSAQPRFPVAGTDLPPQQAPTQQSPVIGPDDGFRSTPMNMPLPPTINRVQTGPVQGDVAQLANTGRRQLAEGRFAEAETTFAQYLAVAPDAEDRDEVYFWLGESRYVQGNHGGAAESYIASMKAKSRGVRAPEAMVKLGASLRELGKTAEACQTLNAFAAQYPNASADVRSKAATEKARTGC